MPVFSASLDSWFPTICALLIPTAVRLRSTFRNNNARSPPAAPLRTPISALLALYTLYILYNIVLARPPNLFTALHLPLNAPQSTIQAALLALSNNGSNSSTSAGKTVLPPALEKLLARLASSEARTMLVRCVPPRPLPLLSSSEPLFSHPLLNFADLANGPSRPVRTARCKPTTRYTRFRPLCFPIPSQRQC
jgi:hypothetical protein